MLQINPPSGHAVPSYPSRHVVQSWDIIFLYYNMNINWLLSESFTNHIKIAHDWHLEEYVKEIKKLERYNSYV